MLLRESCQIHSLRIDVVDLAAEDSGREGL